MTAFWVQGDQTQRKIKWSTDRGLYFCSFNFFFNFKTVFFFFFLILGDGDRQRASNISTPV